MAEKKQETAKGSGKTETELLAAIRVRGTVNINRDIKETLDMLNLRSVNNCVLVPKTESFSGMLKKTESFLTWGEIDQKMLEELVWKRGRLQGEKRLEKDAAKNVAAKIIKGGTLKGTEIKHMFRLTPPSRGHRTVKRLYPKGACGYRGKDINQLIKRMV